MAQNIVGKLPEFTDDASENKGDEQAKVEQATDSTQEKDTTELVDTKPDGEPVVDTEQPDLEQKQEKAIQKLQEERTKLLKEIKELRGTKREIKQDQLDRVEQHLDDLKDLHPDDVSLIDRVLRSKGYMTKDEAGRMFYEAVKQEELDKFLAKYPEYRPENDPDNINWGAIERQIEKEKDMGYSLPKNPHLIGQFLERVHQQVSRVSRDSSAPVKRQLEVASVGSGGTQQSSSPKKLDPDRRFMLSKGGWSEDEILKIESRLPD